MQTTYLTYELWAIVGDRPVRLLGGLASLHEAAYIEQTIRARLHIIDYPVPGAIST
ncbi:MAG: hypothetical protein JXB07_21295 [Anaerolineae bacterium]|nr:hypothetical protein [Anaerolineae bacterium]